MNKPVARGKPKPKPGPPMPEDGLENAPLEQLQTQVHALRERAIDLQTKRNYVQQEKDMVEQFCKNTLAKKDEIGKKLFLWENQMQEKEEQHRLEVKMYLQKMKHLELERDNNTEKVKKEGIVAGDEEEDWHKKKIDELKTVKHTAKTDYVTKEGKNSEKVEELAGQYALDLQHELDSKKKDLQETESTLKNEVEELKAKLELKLKVEIHEIEERKNSHINELMSNHGSAFSALKKFYNDITVENLDLIKAQNAEIANINEKRNANKKMINELKEANKALEVPLYRARRDRKILRDTLKQFEKDKMSLKNLKIKLVSLKEKLEKLKKDKAELEKREVQCFGEKNNLVDRFNQFAGQLKGQTVKHNQHLAGDFERAENEARRRGDYSDDAADNRNNLIGKFNVIASQMKSYVELQNHILLGEFEKMEAELREKEHELQEIIVASKLDPHYVNDVTQQVRNLVDQKNAEIKNLKYLIHHATKAYNDAIRVYSTKLLEFNIDPSELGFQIIESKTSTMPAGLVSS